MENYIRNPNKVNNISNKKNNVNDKIKHKFGINNNIKKLFTDFEITKRDKKYDYNSIVQNNTLNRCESLTAMKIYANIDKEKIVKKISYERKSQINDVLVEDMLSKTAQKSHSLQQLFEKHGDIYPVIDTMKYLAHGQFTMLDKEKDNFFFQQKKCCIHLEDARKDQKEQSTILYSSRDDYPQRNLGFWLFDETGHLPEIVLDKYCLPIPKMDGNQRENIDFSANNLRHSNIRKKTKNTDNWCNYIEKDSLEDCTLLEQRRESNTIFSSLSAENLIYEWIEFLNKKYEINDIDRIVSHGRKLVSSRASLDIARHVRAQIIDDRRSSDTKKSIRELRAHDSNIFARLSPKIRQKIYYLIQKIVSSGFAKDSLFYHKKHLMTDLLNNEKLKQSKSVDAFFVHSNEISNCTNDYILTKLSELLEDKNCLFKKQDNFINKYSQDLNNSKDSVKISYKNTAISMSSDKISKTKILDNFKKVTRHIMYKNTSLLKDIVGNNNEDTVADILTIYCKILENSKNIDWDNFQKLVEILHPDQKELWCDICKTINEETKRIINDANNNTEVCIEISPLVNSKNTLKTDEVTEYTREIVFELIMTLKDVETFFNKKSFSAEKHLDIHKNADKSTTMDWNNDERKTISKQTR